MGEEGQDAGGGRGIGNHQSKGGAGPARDRKYAHKGLVPDLWQVWRQHMMDEVLAGSLLNVAVRLGSGRDGAADAGVDGRNNDLPGDRYGGTQPQPQDAGSRAKANATKASGSQKVFIGGDTARVVGKYVPLLQRPRMETVEVVNARWAAKESLKLKAKARDSIDEEGD